MTTKLQKELDFLPNTYSESTHYRIDGLCQDISRAAGTGIITVGSGGSFSVAVLIAKLHEKVTGNLSRAVTPLELAANPALVNKHPVFLISAEGRNPDVIHAFRIASRSECTSISVLTVADTGYLARLAQRCKNSKVHIVDVLTEKDGYLAINSLIAVAVVFLRAYHICSPNVVPPISKSLDEIFSVHGGYESAQRVFSEKLKPLVRCETLSILYDPDFEACAVDLESKLTECALLNSQLADFRDFAHGRHFWFARRKDTTNLCVICGEGMLPVWEQLASSLPPNITIHLIASEHASWSSGIIKALIQIFFIVKAAGESASVDPGKPGVPLFGRDIYYSDIRKLVSTVSPGYWEGANGKRRSVGRSLLPTLSDKGLEEQKELFTGNLVAARFSSVVLDYDGTICHTHRRFEPPPVCIVKELSRLAKAGITIGIASGRGDSLHTALRETVAKSLWGMFVLGMYNGSYIIRLNESFERPSEIAASTMNKELEALEMLRDLGVPIESLKSQPNQISVTPSTGASISALWHTLYEHFVDHGFEPNRLKVSGHSIDVLGPGVSKLTVVSTLQSKNNGEVLTIGDQGLWPGNDHELLAQPFSLSVGTPSRKPSSGWHIAPDGKTGPSATYWYLQRLELDGKRCFIDLEL
ncbi:HAD hydrolase family protein [Sedimenticola selenatireducens]|uniref:SIS domain-containing protein n=1 Tax=Sedimenticola selenatireducens TaxID=191960 RepID=A0A2N6CSH3_9GAMM|nr:HAD hydrolase family protein [Sedimenticola selenatireducens]PLX60041.1 MAG: hypothetical protein C0630_17475 [Sedimenticola selenatireducens]